MKSRLPKFLYEFSFQREPLWILIFALAVPLIGLLVMLITRLAR